MIRNQTEQRCRKVRARLAYCGLRYQGWQIQKKGATVQETLQQSLTQLAGRPVRVVAAGRTDSGVHALGQVVHFHFPQKSSIPDLRLALNALLPWDIRVLSVKRVAESFHAQKRVTRKRYEYRMFVGPVLSPFLYGRATHVRQALHFEKMASAATLLEGTHDFRGYAAASTSARTFVRTLFLSEMRRQGRHWFYRVEGDGFLHHMVRNIVGTLLEVGRGRRPPQDVSAVLASRNRKLAGPTAPPEGLYLVRVWYENT